MTRIEEARAIIFQEKAAHEYMMARVSMLGASYYAKEHQFYGRFYASLARQLMGLEAAE